MLIIGELLNLTRRQAREALQAKNEAAIRNLACAQVEAGADVIDVNTAMSMQREIEDMEWVIGLIYDELGEGVRLSIDSPNPEAIAAGLALCKARPMINSINTVRAIKGRWGDFGVKTSVGLSNVSFGLPRRSIINRTFLGCFLQPDSMRP